MTGQTATIAQAIARLRQFDREVVSKLSKRAIYRSLDEGRKRAVDSLRRSRIGRMVQRRGERRLELAFQKPGHYTMGQLKGIRESTIPLVIRRMPVKQTGSLGTRKYSSGLETMGFAALIHSGGRTKSHQIKPLRLEGYSRGRKTRIKQLLGTPPMTFQIGGRWVSVRLISHPGSTVPRNPFLDAGGTAAQGALGREFERALAEGMKEAGL